MCENIEIRERELSGRGTNITEHLKIHRNGVLRRVLIFTGTVLVGIGILGIFLPLLPTTIFFLLAAACYARSSEGFYYWLLHNRLFGKYIKDYHSHKGMTLKSKIISLGLMWTAILYTAVFAAYNLYIRIILF